MHTEADNTATPTNALAQLSDSDLETLLNELEDNATSDVFSDYIHDILPKLIELNWGVTTSKTSEFSTENRTLHDQSMLSHITTGVYALVRLYDIESSLCSKEVLRSAVATFVAHDFHKLRKVSYENEFDVTRTEVQEFVDSIGLLEFAPDSDLDDYIGAIALLHASSDYAKRAAAPLSFDRLRSLLLFADALASTKSIEEFDENHNAGRHLRDCLGGDYTLNTHKIDSLHGLAGNVINKSVSETLESHGYDLLAIYQDGCVYVGSDRTPKISPTPAIAENILENTRKNLRNTHPAFRNEEMMLVGFPLETAGRYYKISRRDFFFATPEEIVRAISTRAVADAEKITDLPETEQDRLEEIEELTGESLDSTRRLDGMAILLHTIYHELLGPILVSTSDSEVDRESLELWEYDEIAAIFKLFDISEETQERVYSLLADHPDVLEDTTSWDIKYVLAMDVIENYYTGADPETLMAKLSDDLITQFEDYQKWDGLRAGLVSPYTDEFNAFVIANVSIDGTYLADSVKGTELYGYINSFKKRAKKLSEADRPDQCSICNERTSVPSEKGVELLKEKPDIHIHHHDGSLQLLSSLKNSNAYCTACQVDILLRLTRQDILESGKSRDKADNMYIHVMPNYFYTPVSWALYRTLYDRYTQVESGRVLELAQSVFETDAAQGFVEWMDVVTGPAGEELLSTPEIAFDPDTGFGSHALGHARTEDHPTHDLFVALSAAAHAGVRIFISPDPLANITTNDFDTAVKISPEYERIYNLTGGEIRLSELDNVMTTIAAMILICDRLGVTRDPLQYLIDSAQGTPLPGSKMLVEIIQKSRKPVDEYVAPTRHIDEMLVESYLYSGDDRDSSWAFDITSNDIINPHHLHKATETLAAYSWPFMTPESFAIGELTQPILAAIGGVVQAHNTYGGTTSDREYAQHVEERLLRSPSINTPVHGRTFDGRLTGFSECFVEDILNTIGRGEPRHVERLRAPIRDAYYAAVYELATKSLTTGEVE